MFYERLKKLRKGANLTQSEFAEKIGAHYQTVSKWERGVSIPDLSMLDVFAKTLRVSIETLLSVDVDDGTLGNGFNCKKMGKTLAELRKRKGVSQAELGKEIDVSSDNISKWERGVICPDMEKFIAISAYFSIAPSRIYYGELVQSEKETPLITPKKRNIFKYIAVFSACVLLVVSTVFAFWENIFKNGELSSSLPSTSEGVGNTDLGSSSGDSDDSNDTEGGADSVTNPELSPETPPSFILPVTNGKLLTAYGMGYNATLGQFIEHSGIDFSATQGQEVFACMDGTVTIEDGDLLEGVDIIITTSNGIKLVYRYADPVEGLKTGDSVRQGAVIGYVCETRGTEYKLGPHLHIEIYKENVVIDPTEYFSVE